MLAFIITEGGACPFILRSIQCHCSLGFEIIKKCSTMSLLLGFEMIHFRVAYVSTSSKLGEGDNHDLKYYSVEIGIGMRHRLEIDV